MRMRGIQNDRGELGELEEWLGATLSLPRPRPEFRERVAAQVPEDAWVAWLRAVAEPLHAEPRPRPLFGRRIGFPVPRRTALALASAGLLIVPAAALGAAGLTGESISNIINSTSQAITSLQGSGQSSASGSSSFTATSSGNEGTTTTTSSQTSQSNQLSSPAAGIASVVGSQVPSVLSAANLNEQIAAVAQAELDNVSHQTSSVVQTGSGGNVNEQVTTILQNASTSANQATGGSAPNVNNQVSTLAQSVSQAVTKAAGGGSGSNLNQQTSLSQKAIAAAVKEATGQISLPDVSSAVNKALGSVSTIQQQAQSAAGTVPNASPNAGNPASVQGLEKQVQEQTSSIAQNAQSNVSNQTSSFSQSNANTSIATPTIPSVAP